MCKLKILVKCSRVFLRHFETQTTHENIFLCHRFRYTFHRNVLFLQQTVDRYKISLARGEHTFNSREKTIVTNSSSSSSGHRDSPGWFVVRKSGFFPTFWARAIPTHKPTMNTSRVVFYLTTHQNRIVFTWLYWKLAKGTSHLLPPGIAYTLQP